jgi:DNA-binding transcriptional regulator LsrR (DeoR family)
MTQAAWLYYVHGLDQSEVAERLGVSRSRVSRLLAAAKDAGIVEIRVHGASTDVLMVGAELERRLGLGEVLVEQALDGESPRQTAARAAARFLDRIVEEPIRIGIGWGRTLGLIPQFVQRRDVNGVEIVEIVGHPNWTGDGLAFEASASLAACYGVPVGHVPAPALVATATIASHLLKDSAVSVALSRASAAEVCLLAIGHVNPRDSPLIAGRVLEARELANLAKSRAVGDFALHFFDKSGAPVPGPHEDRLIGLSRLQLMGIPRRIAVAAGDDKVEPILASVRGGLITGLITDLNTARGLLAAET